MWTPTQSRNWQGSSPRVRALFLLFVGSLLFVVGLALLSGCAGTAGVVRALAHDTNSVSVKLTTPYGVLDYERNAGKAP